MIVMKKEKPIGLFDSGVGGLTVLKEIKKNLPKENIIYFGDNLRAPYGSRDSKEILEFCLNIGKFLQEKEVKMLVIACNTATVVSLDKLKESLDIPVVGVIYPGALEAVRESHVKRIGVFSTPITAKMNAYKNEIIRVDSKAEVYQVGCESLCEIIESGWKDTKENRDILKYYVNKLEKSVDVVVFGCTHYPIIKEYFQRELEGKKIIDPAKETAIEVKKKLSKNDILNESDKEAKIYFYTSGDIEKFKKLGESILGEKIEIVRKALSLN